MIEELERRLARYPADRYPVQHATTRFHLGVALANAGRLDEADSSLRAAIELFDRLPVERAQALNARGAALRLAGRLDEAADAFAQAAATFARQDRAVDEAAAVFNLGLVRRELGDPYGAVECFERARASLDSPAPYRELGATLLGLGELDRARAVLEEATAVATRAGNQVELGAAANALGLVHLTAGRTEEAVRAFRAAAGAHPRSVRPADYAMAKANLALAHADGGDSHRARLAARQALAVPGAPAPVTEQAAAVIDRLGAAEGDLVRVLADEDEEARPAVLREDVARWLDGGDDESAALVEAGFAELWLGALLELPPEQMELLIERAAPSLGDKARPRVASAMARFHTPQLLRLQEAFERVAGGTWR